MFAVIQIGGAQFKVNEGDVIDAPLLDKAVGDEVSVDEVLMLVNDQDVRVGQPFLKNVKVEAKVVKETKGPKTIAFKFRKRKDSQTTRGHRQKFTVLNITKIQG